jgi:hypothetical protein
MNFVKMFEMADAHTRFGNYELAKNLAKRIEDILDAVKSAPDKLAEEANCCCLLRDRTEVGMTSCTACFWEARANLVHIKARLGLA